MKVCIVAEGCYPYVVGGVSGWINSMIKSFPNIEFILLTIVANRSVRGKFVYELPENLTQVYELYLEDCEWEEGERERKVRKRFHLSKKDKEYIAEKGLATIRKHAEDFVAKRLAPAVIPNDGKQTPMRGHPVFIAQHATGCCCRGCFFKWHHIPTGRQLTEEEQQYAVAVLMTWIEKQV